MNRIGMLFTIIPSPVKVINKQELDINKSQKYTNKNTPTPTHTHTSYAENVLINDGTRNILKTRNTNLIVSNGSMRQFLASGGVGKGCSCGKGF